MNRSHLLFFIASLTLVAGALPAQAQSCAFSLRQPPAVLQLPAEGGSGTWVLGVTTAPNSVCPFSSATSAPWLQVFPLSGVVGYSAFNPSPTVTVYFTVFPNFSGFVRLGTMVVGGIPVTISQAANTGTSNERFVRLLYFGFFGRVPSTAEVAFHVNSGLSRTDLVLAFLNSPELATGGRLVAGLYLGLLGRDPEYGGWLFQRTALVANGVSPLALVSNFINSDEFAARGALGNDAFVILLYSQILQRTPSGADVAWHSAALAAGTTRAQLAAAFLASDEFRQSTAPRLTAFLLYAALLMRAPSALEVQTVATLMAAGGSLRSTVDALVTSPELLAMLATPTGPTPF